MEPPTYPEISFISKSGTKLLEKNIGNNFLDVLNCSSLYDSVLNGCLEVKRRVMPRKPLNSTLRAQICPEMTTSITSSAEQYYREFAAPYYRDFDVPVRSDFIPTCFVCDIYVHRSGWRQLRKAHISICV
ncbi:hypothetical protein COOONC_11905 [Cooperia oncophora]